MLSGGNILHHLEMKGTDQNNIIFIVGFQAKGTLGYDLLNGDTEFKNSGKSYTIKAEVINFTNFSSHADKEELLNWVEKSNAETIFLTHGENDQKEELKRNLLHKYDIKVIIPKRCEKYKLSDR